MEEAAQKLQNARSLAITPLKRPCALFLCGPSNRCGTGASFIRAIGKCVRISDPHPLRVSQEVDSDRAELTKLRVAAKSRSTVDSPTIRSLRREMAELEQQQANFPLAPYPLRTHHAFLERNRRRNGEKAQCAAPWLRITEE